MEALRALSCEDIVLKFNSDVKPIIITNSEDSNLIELILPIRTY